MTLFPNYLQWIYYAPTSCVAELVMTYYILSKRMLWFSRLSYVNQEVSCKHRIWMVDEQPYQSKICTVIFYDVRSTLYKSYINLKCISIFIQLRAILFSNMNHRFNNISITYELDKVVKSGFTLDYVLWTI